MSFSINRRDLEFLLFDWLDVEALLKKPRYSAHTRETLNGALDLGETIAMRWFAPAYKKSDAQEPWIDAQGVHVLPEIAQAVREYAASGLVAAPFDEMLGGLQLPETIYAACIGQCMAANIAASAFPMLSVANARLIAAFGSTAQVAQFVAPQLTGEAMATMCLSEPQAGSSLGDIRTIATEDGEDALGRRFRLRGNKMWISGGDHDVTANIIHLVLAKTLGPDGKALPGAKGISLFIAPKILPDGGRNDIAVAGLNHKMGYRGISNCLLNFGEGAQQPGGQDGAVGYLVGEIGQGLPQMFHMMNEARISVGLGAAMLAYRGYRQSLDYARERLQGRSPGAAAPVPIIAHADVRRMLLAQKAYADGALALVFYCARLLDEKVSGEPAAAATALRLLELLTPIAKTWPSEQGLMANEMAIQIHGGYGYTRDFDVEQIYRDNRLNPIHEGTTGVQALDLVGRKLRDKEALDALRQRVSLTTKKARASATLSPLAPMLEAVWARIDDYAAVTASPPNRAALDNSTPFLRAFGHAVVGWLWLDMALRCDPVRDTFQAGKLAACQFFFAEELPRATLWIDIAQSASDLISNLEESAF